MSPDDPIPPIDEPTDEAEALTEEAAISETVPVESAVDDVAETEADASEEHAESDSTSEAMDAEEMNTELPAWPEDDSGGSTGCLKALAACGCFFMLAICAIIGVAIWVGFDAVGEAKQAFFLDEMTIEDSGYDMPSDVDNPTEAPEVDDTEVTDDEEASDLLATDPRWRKTAPRREWDVQNPCVGTLRQRSAALEMQEASDELPDPGEADEVLPDEGD